MSTEIQEQALEQSWDPVPNRNAAESLSAEIEITHLNLNDRTIAGLQHKTLPCFSVQYHPEASPGPHEVAPMFEVFIQAMLHRLQTQLRALRAASRKHAAEG